MSTSTSQGEVRADWDEVRQMWTALLRERWRSLALVPTCEGTWGRDLVAPLAEMARRFEMEPVKAVDAIGATLDGAVALARELVAGATARRAVAVVDRPLQNPGAVPIVLASDAVVLLVRLGESEFEEVRRVMALVGHERMLGAILLRHDARWAAALQPRRSGQRPQSQPLPTLDVRR